MPQLRAVQVSLRNVTPSIPEGDQERAQLEEDLKKMRCEGLLERPSGLKHEDIMGELLMEQPNIFDTTVRDWPKQWTSKLWREVYNFPEGGAGLANRTNTFVDGKYIRMVDPKDGYPVRDCRNARHRRLLEFIVSIIRPNKPTRVTITIENTIFRALDGGRPVDWGVVFQDLAQRLAARVGKLKPTLIFPFLFHLYDSQGLLTEEEETDYKTA